MPPPLLLALLAQLVVLFGSGADPCTLRSLQLRSSDQPVDLSPPFSPSTFSYEAKLNFAMESFSLDAAPIAGCEVSGVPNQAIPAPAEEQGETTAKQLTVYAKSLASGEQQGYRIKVTKRLGSETEVVRLRVEGAKLRPFFSPEILSYTAELPLASELIEVAYVLQDDGQKVRCQADPEVGAEASRRLQEVGESQYHERRQAFPVDVGGSRSVRLTVESADPMQAAVETYTVDVTRPGCNPARPLFDPVSAACVVNCPQQMYANSAASRCSYCNTNCEVCSSITHCQLCFKDTIHRSYQLQPDGSCLELQARFMKKYYWWCVSLAICLGLLLCLGLGSFCQWLCDCCCAPRRPKYDSDSDNDFERRSVLKR